MITYDTLVHLLNLKMRQCCVSLLSNLMENVLRETVFHDAPNCFVDHFPICLWIFAYVALWTVVALGINSAEVASTYQYFRIILHNSADLELDDFRDFLLRLRQHRVEGFGLFDGTCGTICRGTRQD